MYAVIGTRPDLSFTTTFFIPIQLESISFTPTGRQTGTPLPAWNYGLVPLLSKGPATKPSISCYSDASYANDLNTRRSFSGYLIRFGEAAISWCCQKQRSVALSTTEAEYMAMSLAAKQLMWIKRGTDDLRLQDVDYYLLGDNQGSLELARNPGVHGRSKHIDTHYHFVREKVEEKHFELLYVPTQENLADLLTKALPKPRHHELVPHHTLH
jgi:hypothetical protein